MIRVSSEFIRRQDKLVAVTCDWHTQVAQVAISRMGRYGGYVTRRYQVERWSPSAGRLWRVLRDYQSVYRAGASRWEIARGF